MEIASNDNGSTTEGVTSGESTAATAFTVDLESGEARGISKHESLSGFLPEQLRENASRREQQLKKRRDNGRRERELKDQQKRTATEKNDDFINQQSQRHESCQSLNATTEYIPSQDNSFSEEHPISTKGRTYGVTGPKHSSDIAADATSKQSPDCDKKISSRRTHKGIDGTRDGNDEGEDLSEKISESGTYTIDEVNQDVEEARANIDKVFGVDSVGKMRGREESDNTRIRRKEDEDDESDQDGEELDEERNDGKDVNQRNNKNKRKELISSLYVETGSDSEEMTDDDKQQIKGLTIYYKATADSSPRWLKQWHDTSDTITSSNKISLPTVTPEIAHFRNSDVRQTNGGASKKPQISPNQQVLTPRDSVQPTRLVAALYSNSAKSTEGLSISLPQTISFVATSSTDETEATNDCDTNFQSQDYDKGYDVCKHHQIVREVRHEGSGGLFTISYDAPSKNDSASNMGSRGKKEREESGGLKRIERLNFSGRSNSSLETEVLLSDLSAMRQTSGRDKDRGRDKRSLKENDADGVSVDAGTFAVADSNNPRMLIVDDNLSVELVDKKESEKLKIKSKNCQTINGGKGLRTGTRSDQKMPDDLGKFNRSLVDTSTWTRSPRIGGHGASAGRNCKSLGANLPPPDNHYYSSGEQSPGGHSPRGNISTTRLNRAFILRQAKANGSSDNEVVLLQVRSRSQSDQDKRIIKARSRPGSAGSAERMPGSSLTVPKSEESQQRNQQRNQKTNSKSNLTADKFKVGASPRSSPSAIRMKSPLDILATPTHQSGGERGRGRSPRSAKATKRDRSPMVAEMASRGRPSKDSAFEAWKRRKDYDPRRSSADGRRQGRGAIGEMGRAQEEIETSNRYVRAKSVGSAEDCNPSELSQISYRASRTDMIRHLSSAVAHDVDILTRNTDDDQDINNEQYYGDTVISAMYQLSAKVKYRAQNISCRLRNCDPDISSPSSKSEHDVNLEKNADFSQILQNLHTTQRYLEAVDEFLFKTTRADVHNKPRTALSDVVRSSPHFVIERSYKECRGHKTIMQSSKDLEPIDLLNDDEYY